MEDITFLQDHAKFDIIMINGHVHEASRKEVMLQPRQRISRQFSQA